MTKRIAAFFICISLLLSGLPVNAGAEKPDSVMGSGSSIARDDDTVSVNATDINGSLKKSKKVHLAAYLTDYDYSLLSKDARKQYNKAVKSLDPKDYDSIIFARNDNNELVYQVSISPEILFGETTGAVTGEEDYEIETVYGSMDMIDMSLFGDEATDSEAAGSDDNDTVKSEAFNTIMSEDKTYYNQLSSGAKSHYKAAYKAIVYNGKNQYRYTGSTPGNNYTLSTNFFAAACDAINALILTYPADFDWLDRGTSMLKATGTIGNNGGNAYVTVVKGAFYKDSMEKQAEYQVDRVVNEAFEYAQEYRPDDVYYGVVEYFDRWLCDNCYYNYNGTSAAYAGTEEYYLCHCAYGALLYGYGVCESYALAMNRLLDGAGFPSRYITGYCDSGNIAGSGHAWNYVLMPDNNYYLLDSTWNDTGFTPGYLLIPDDGRHIPTGALFSVAGAKSGFKFPERSNVSYTSRNFKSTSLQTVPGGKKIKLPVLSFFIKYAEVEVADPDILTVYSSGKVKGLAGGNTTCTVDFRGHSFSFPCMIYGIEALQTTTGGVTLRQGYLSNYVYVYVQKSPGTELSMQELIDTVGLEEVITSTFPRVADAAYIEIRDDTISFRIRAKKKGTCKLKVNLGGKKVTIKVKVKK